MLAHLAGTATSSTVIDPITHPGLDPLDLQTVLSQWQRLGSLDPKSHDHDELLRTLVDAEGNKEVAMKFTGNDARIVINIIDEVSFCDIVDRASTSYVRATLVPSSKQSSAQRLSMVVGARTRLLKQAARIASYLRPND